MPMHESSFISFYNCQVQALARLPRRQAVRVLDRMQPRVRSRNLTRPPLTTNPTIHEVLPCLETRRNDELWSKFKKPDENGKRLMPVSLRLRPAVSESLL